MKIDKEKLDRVLAEQCKAASDLRQQFFSPATISRIRRGRDVGTKTAGKLARALDVPLERLIETEANKL
jgi:DNA-binding Xre family transcriptional regulator